MKNDEAKGGLYSIMLNENKMQTNTIDGDTNVS